jgi:Flp pilus assembly protein TadB
MKAIRASDIGSYLYCRRAWWYRLHGQESINQAELAAGTELHRAHGRKVLSAGLMSSLAWFILLAALVILVAYGTNWLLGNVR